MMVDFWSAQAYAEWLAARTGQAWHLPTEIQWEKAARGVDGRFFPFGDHFESTWCRTEGEKAGDLLPDVVGSYPIDVSPYGVRGLAGNVRDWCLDLHDQSISGDSPPDRNAPRVIRGGAYMSPEAFSRCASRYAARPHSRYSLIGFRLAYAIETSP